MKTKKPLSTHEMRAIRSTLLERTGCLLKDYLIEQAFTRSSYSKRYGGGSNENLEYIGDTILGYHVVRQLYKHYGTIHSDEEKCVYTFRAHERDFTTLKSTIVSNHTLAAIIDEWNVCQYLIVGQPDIDNEVDKREKIRADLFEAIIGAYAVQFSWDQTVMDQIISKVLPIEKFILDYEKTRNHPAEFSADNAINTLKELTEHEMCSVPVYEITGPNMLGYNKSGSPRWSCICTVQDKGIRKGVSAHSKKDARKYSAYLALCDIYGLPNEYGPSKSLSWWYFDGDRLMLETPSDF